MRVITGTARGRRLKTPENYDIRPTTDNVKESVFNIIQFDIEGRRVLDLFAGTGQLGIECLSRGAAEAVFIDENTAAVKIVKENLKTCGFTAAVLQQDALSYLRMIACRDDLSFLRIANVPKRNLGERRMAFLKDYAAQNGCSLYDALRRNLDSELLRGTKGGKFVSLIESFTGIYDQMPVSELLAAVLNESGYEAMLRTEGSQMRLDNLAELKQSIYAYETTCGEECTLEHYLAHVALFTNADLDDPRDQVRLMTVHSAKGLEFPHVFLCAMNEGIFPSKKTRTLPGMEEERRLCFVAMTRAQKALYLSEAEGRNLDGSPRYPSRFLLDIDDSLLTFTHTPREDLIRQAREYIGFSTRLLDESSLPQGFAPGTRVRHAVFGDGTVLELDPAQKAQLVQFDSMSTPRLLSLRAKLEQIG